MAVADNLATIKEQWLWIEQNVVPELLHMEEGRREGDWTAQEGREEKKGEGGEGREGRGEGEGKE